MDRALVLLDRARALTPMDDPAYPIVLLRWADAARQAARLPAAAEALEEAVARFEEHGDPVRAGEALSLMSSVRHRLGEADTKLSVRAVAVLEPYPGPELVAALAQLAGTEILRGEHSASIAAADRALTLADQLGLSLPARALGFRGLARCYEGDLEGLNETHRALGLLIAEGRSRDAAVLQTNIAGLRGYLEGPAAALAGLEEAGSFATHHGLTAVAEETAVATLWSLLEVGRLDALRRQAGHLAPQLREGGALWSLSEVRATEARARFEQGDPATSAADEAVELARDADDPLLLTAAIAAAALAHAGNSDPDAARALLTELTDVGIRNEPEYAPYLPALARAACAISAPDLIARLSAGVPDRHPFQQHALMAVRAIETELAGNHARAADLYAEAAERWHAFTSTLEEAHALLGEGRCRAHLADPAATSPLSSARALFAGMNARPRVVECDAQLARVAPATG